MRWTTLVGAAHAVVLVALSAPGCSTSQHSFEGGGDGSTPRADAALDAVHIDGGGATGGAAGKDAAAEDARGGRGISANLTSGAPPASHSVGGFDSFAFSAVPEAGDRVAYRPSAGE